MKATWLPQAQPPHLWRGHNKGKPLKKTLERSSRFEPSNTGGHGGRAAVFGSPDPTLITPADVAQNWLLASVQCQRPLMSSLSLDYLSRCWVSGEAAVRSAQRRSNSRQVCRVHMEADTNVIPAPGLSSRVEFTADAWVVGCQRFQHMCIEGLCPADLVEISDSDPHPIGLGGQVGWPHATSASKRAADLFDKARCLELKRSRHRHARRAHSPGDESEQCARDAVSLPAYHAMGRAEPYTFPVPRISADERRGFEWQGEDASDTTSVLRIVLRRML